MPRLFLYLLLTLSATAIATEANVAGKIPNVDQAPVGGDFILHSDQGDVSLQDFRGKATLLYFGYSKCPDVCPASLAIVTQALNVLSEAELEKTQALFVSLDQARDSYAGLREYAHHFHPNLMGITGSELEVAQVASQYGVKYSRVELAGSAFGYAVNHSSATYLVSPEGELRFIFPYKTPAAALVEAVRYVLTPQPSKNQ